MTPKSQEPFPLSGLEAVGLIPAGRLAYSEVRDALRYKAEDKGAGRAYSEAIGSLLDGHTQEVLDPPLTPELVRLLRSVGGYIVRIGLPEREHLAETGLLLEAVFEHAYRRDVA